MHSTSEKDPHSTTAQCDREDPALEDLLSPHDIGGAGALGFAVLCDSPEHPDRRIPYRLAEGAER